MYYTRKLYNLVLLYFSEPYRTRFHIPFKILCANTDHFIVHSACLQHSTVTMRLDSLFGCGHLKDDWNIHFLLESYARPLSHSSLKTLLKKADMYLI